MEVTIGMVEFAFEKVDVNKALFLLGFVKADVTKALYLLGFEKAHVPKTLYFIGIEKADVKKTHANIYKLFALVERPALLEACLRVQSWQELHVIKERQQFVLSMPCFSLCD